MNKILKRIIPCLLVLMVLFVSGCTNQDYTLVVNSDDSARFTVRFAVNKDTYDLLSAYDIEKNYKFEQSSTSANNIERCDVLFQETAAVFYEYGFKINPINDAVEIGFEGVKEYKTIEALNKDLEKLYNDGLIKLKGTVTKTESLLAQTYVFSGSVEYLMDPDAEDLSESERYQILELYDTSGLNAEVSLRLPGDLVALDGVVEDSMAKYKVSYEDNKEVPVHLKTQIVNTTLRTGIFIGVGVVAFVAFFFISKANKHKKEARKMRELYGDEDMDDEEY